MVASLVSGKTWSTNESCTAAKLNSMFSGASISGIIQAELAANNGLVVTGTSAPSDTNAIWLDSNDSNQLKVHNGSSWFFFVQMGRMLQR